MMTPDNERQKKWAQLCKQIEKLDEMIEAELKPKDLERLVRAKEKLVKERLRLTRPISTLEAIKKAPFPPLFPPKKYQLRLSAGWEDDSPVKSLCCPICQNERTIYGDAYVHFSEPRLVGGQDNYKAHPGTIRGSAIEFDCYNETCGHKFKVIFGFHKGMTFAWAEKLPANYKVKEAE